jgi:diguanylate cyclase (GGDEF)-like protein/PAS domain S-box-containing protein
MPTQTDSTVKIARRAGTSLWQTEERFRLLVDAVQDYSIYMLDLEGRVMSWNHGAERNKGYTSSEIVGKHFSLFFRPEDQKIGLPGRILRQVAEAGRFKGECWFVRKDGSLFWALVVVTALRDRSGHLIGYAKVTRDLTERKQQEEALRSSQRALQVEKNRLQVTLHSIVDGVISTDADGCITMMNPMAESMTGWSFSEAKGKRIEQIFCLVDAEDGIAIENPVRDCLELDRPVFLQDGVLLVAQDGSRRDIQDSVAPIRAEDGAVLGAILIFQDVTRMRAIQKQVAFNANHDALTLLPNRKFFLEKLTAALNRAKATGTEHTLCFLDLDRFKIINDTAGHAAGDVLLRTVADLLMRNIRKSDLVARLGGDEFAIIFHDCSVEGAQGTLTRIMEDIAAFGFRWEEKTFRVSLSIGVASVTGRSDLSTVMKQADVACYSAKHAGRNRVSIYQSEQSDVHERHLQIQVAADIRDAIAQNRFSLFAQRIATLRNSQTFGYEILLRMHDPAGRIIMPAQFIPAAERYDQMAHLDRWVLQNVLRKYGSMFPAGKQICVNVSANSLNDPQFLPFLMSLVDSSTFPPELLTLEITETALVNNLANAGDTIEKIRARKCKVALDDFGVGLCSFNYLRNFSVDFIKIDGGFIRNLPQSSVDLCIVKAIHSIAHEVHAQTIAESVESEFLLTTVKQLDIDLAQGYVLELPQPIETSFGNGSRTSFSGLNLSRI